LSLLAPWFLAGLVGIALPVWLHRLSSENPNKQAFSSLMFLEPGEPRRVLAKNLQYLLLLALRIGFLVLLVLAFSGPTCFRVPAAASGDGARHHLIVLDASASLGYGNRWRAARAAAREIVGDLDVSDTAQVVLFGRTAEILTRPTGDPAVLRGAIDTAEPGVFRVDDGQLMSALDGLMRTATLPVAVHIVTDAQASGLPPRFADLAPREPASIEVIDVAGGAREDNWAIDSFGGSPITGELQASIRSFAAAESTRTLELRLEDAIVDQQTVVVPAGGSVSVSFTPLTLRAGSNRASLRLAPGDELGEDDVRFLALQRPEPRPVLVLASDLRGEDALFVTAALETLAALVIEPTVAAPGDSDDLDFGDYRFVIVTDAGGLEQDVVARLSDYVESGGAVLMALGPRSATLAAVPITEQTIAPTSLGGRREEIAIGSLDAGHPALRGVASLRAARVYRYVQVEPAPEDAMLIGLDSGAPLLLERNFGAGRILLYTSTLDRQWNDVVVQPEFVPFISGLANHMLGTSGFTTEAPLGSVLSLRSLGFVGGQVFDPLGDVALGLGGTDDVLLDQIGYYEVVSSGISRFVAVNFDTRESDLRAMDAATIERWEALGRAADAVEAQGLSETRQPEPLPLGLWIFALLVVLIIVESWAGNWHLRVQRGIAS